MPEIGQRKRPSESKIDPSDSDLAERIRRSDEAAFKALYYRYYQPLFKFIWRRVQNDEATKDLTQVLFIRVWKGRDRLDAGQVVKAYLYRIAANLVIDYFRAKGKSKSFDLEALDVEPSEDLDRQFELEEAVSQAIDQLPKPLQEAFKLSRLEGMKNGEIAVKLGVSIKTVESRMTRAFTILRKQLKPLLMLLIYIEFFFES